MLSQPGEEGTPGIGSFVDSLHVSLEVIAPYSVND